MKIMNNFEALLCLFVAFFITVTGTWLIPQIADSSTNIFTLGYTLSIMGASVYFILQAFSIRKIKKRSKIE